tara:strand:- start:631 stop:1770 length:1140 start_codon:yes stop_codon:yes gene_type:complete
MFKTVKKGFLPFLVGFSALSVSGSAAFYSVFGLSKLFAGASTEVIIMAGSLEVAKLVTASLLYQYWDTINKVLKYYLTLAVVILILITSMGIYGFLSSAYQDTFNELTYVENEKKFLNQKIEFYQQDVTRYEKELQQTLDNITSLSEARSVSIQVKDTSVVGGIRNTISTVDLRAAQDRLRIEEDKRKDVNLKRDIAVDSLRTYQRQILELDNNADVAGELGPLKYIAGLTGYPMDKIINVLLLIIIFVFDPLAVSLVVAANFAYNQAFPKKKYRENLYEEKVEVEGATLEEQAKYTNWENEANVFDDYSEEDEKRMDIIGQNGNEGDHYEPSREEKENIVEKGINDAIKGKAGATPANFNRITARKILDNLDNLTKTY